VTGVGTTDLFDRIADLPVRIEGYDLATRERDTSSGFTRKTTVVTLAGADHRGRGEDVTYESEEHDRLLEAHDFDLTGEHTVASFSASLEAVDLFPAGPPAEARFRHYRRWAFESAALDLALRQTDTTLADALDRTYDPVRFVASTRLGDPPSADRVHALLDRVPGIELKLDPTPGWSLDLIDDLTATDAVRILDLKAGYEGTEVATETNPTLYRTLLSAFPEAIIEDPGVTEETESMLEEAGDRLSWDLPIEGLKDVHALPWEPRWLNVKPSRFGTVESLFETVAYCLENDVRMYGGGQFELGVGRGQIQALASLFYPEGPNDVAPRAYNDPNLPETLPASPLAPPEGTSGFRW
jgi:hypothetical protein